MVGGGGDDESVVDEGVVDEVLVFCLFDDHAVVSVIMEVIVTEVV